MNINQKIDYDEEISSIIPYDIDENVYIKYFEFEENLVKNTTKSCFAKYLENLFNESWILFVFLNILDSFKKTTLTNSSQTNNIIQNSFLNSQYIFWKNVECFQNFIVIKEDNLNQTLISKIAVLTHVSIKIMISLEIIEEKKNYVKTLKNNTRSFFNEFYNKEVYNYRLLLDVKTKKNFNVENKFYRSPLQIIDYKFPTQIINSNKEKKIEWKHKSIICGPTYIRSEPYDKTNPFSSECIKIKDKKLRTIYSETKFYPDIEFIEHLKKIFYHKLNINEINEELNKLKTEYENYFKEINWNESTMDNIKLLQQRYAKLLEDKKTYIFLNHTWSEYYHLSTTHDYRGRKYYCSPLTFTHFKLSRFCFHYGYDGSCQKSFFDWSNYIEIFKSLSKDLNNDLLEIIGFYLIGLGKLDESRKSKIETPLEEVLKKGKEFFLEEENSLYKKIENIWIDTPLKEKIEIIEYECYKFGLKKFLKGDRTKRIILKDATASGYQIQAYLVGSNEENQLKYLNLGEENLFIDTYLFIVNEFDKFSKIPDWALKYFKRSIIKKFCMIIPYSAGFDECFSNIKEFIIEEEYKKTTLIFSMFYDFIKKDLWKSFGLKSSFNDFIKNYIKNEKYSIESETAKANLQYNKTKNIAYDTTFLNIEGKKTRTSREYFIKKDEIDYKKTMTAFAPNFTHFHDSEIVRILHLEPYNLEFASVHDAFIVSCFECGKLTYSYGSIFKIKIRFSHKIPITCIV